MKKAIDAMNARKNSAAVNDYTTALSYWPGEPNATAGLNKAKSMKK